jgi:hypothetical protein
MLKLLANDKRQVAAFTIEEARHLIHNEVGLHNIEAWRDGKDYLLTEAQNLSFFLLIEQIHNAYIPLDYTYYMLGLETFNQLRKLLWRQLLNRSCYRDLDPERDLHVLKMAIRLGASDLDLSRICGTTKELLYIGLDKNNISIDELKVRFDTEDAKFDDVNRNKFWSDFCFDNLCANLKTGKKYSRKKKGEKANG